MRKKSIKPPKPSRRWDPDWKEIEVLKLKRVWFHMPLEQRLHWARIFAEDAPAFVHRGLIRLELGVCLWYDSQLHEFFDWVFDFDAATRFQKN